MHLCWDALCGDALCDLPKQAGGPLRFEQRFNSPPSSDNIRRLEDGATHFYESHRMNDEASRRKTILIVKHQPQIKILKIDKHGMTVVYCTSKGAGKRMSEPASNQAKQTAKRKNARDLIGHI